MLKTFCLNCNDEREYEIKEVEKEYDVKGTKVNVTIQEVYCRECGNKLFIYRIERRNQIKVFDEYKKKVGLLTSEDIVRIRKKYHLTQEELAKIIRCGDKNIARYESGAIQDQSINLLIKMVDEHPEYFGLVNSQEFIANIIHLVETKYIQQTNNPYNTKGLFKTHKKAEEVYYRA